MDDLTSLRNEIDIVDKQMAELFCRRMQTVGKVAEFKREHGLPVLDKGREEQLITKNAQRIEDTVLRSYYTNFITSTMSLSRQYQHRLLEGMRIAYCGAEGAFASIAATRIFPDGNRIPYTDFKAAYNAVVQGDCDCAVLPIENSYAGEVGQVMDMLFSGTLYVNGIYDLPLNQNLLGLPGTRKEDIRQVVSHPQALDQCAGYIRKNGFNQMPYANTALAAQYVKDCADKHIAAIASDETAELYGLEIIESKINEDRLNTTRFAVFSRASNFRPDADPSNSFIMVFTVRNEAGMLADAIGIIGKYGFNMRVLRSRPLKGLMWQYYFYVESEGDPNSESGKKMLEKLAECCDKLKIAGTFSSKTI